MVSLLYCHLYDHEPKKLTSSIKYKSAEEPLGERETMWVETIDKLLEDESLRKNYSEKARQRAEDFRIEKIVQEWKEVLG